MIASTAWATDARVITHAMAAFWEQVHGEERRKCLERRRRQTRQRGSVVRLAFSRVGYRLRACPEGVAIEMASGTGKSVDVLGFAPDAETARVALADLRLDHARPVLPEVGL